MLDSAHRKLVEKRIGDFSSIPSADLLASAMEAEEMKIAVGANDPAWSYFYYLSKAYLDAATIRECEELTQIN